ncbi:MAG TPA: hypothetical protein VFU17_06190 [Candidatus Limnocylindrales bacterium]|nr:hypothetical protein [Candidatus Limnocylindrales bacterium]
MTRFEALVSVLRDISRSALAGLIVGVVVLGLGGRVVMRLAALIDPASVGRRTENGNRIGDITLEGTAVLIIFGGLLVGAAASVVWIATQEWIPGRSWARALLAMPIAVALTGFQLVRPENHDFRILAPVGPILVLLLALVALAGFAFAVVDGWLDRRLPEPAPRLTPSVVVYVLMILAGVPFFILTVRMYLEPGFAVRNAPVGSGLAIFAVGLVTAAAWVARVAGGRRDPPRPLRFLGGVALAVAVATGAWLLSGQIAQVIVVATAAA